MTIPPVPSAGTAASRHLLGPARQFDRLRQPGHGRVFEERRQRHFELERGAQPRHELCGQQRVAAEVEEVVERAHPRHREQVLAEITASCSSSGERGAT